MKVYIMRGLPGSGKTTWAERLYETVNVARVIVSADNYHMVWENGKYHYRFKTENARAAHDDCLKRFAKAVADGYPEQTLFVDNTNISVWEIAPYYRLAEAFGAEVEIILFECTVEHSIARNTHDVPEATIRGMYARLQAAELPPWWKQKTVK